MTSDEFNQFKQDIKDIKDAVIGNTRWGHKGLIERVEGLESWRNSINLKAAFYSGGATTLVLIAKAGYDYLTGGHK